jgi:hypothetical protein
MRWILWQCVSLCIVLPVIAEDFLAKPSDISIDTGERIEHLNTTLGKVTLRWPRSIEDNFKSLPNRAVMDAFDTVNRTIRSGGLVPQHLIPPQISTWDIVLIDDDLRSTEIPKDLRSKDNCHPGWMTAPSNIYIVTSRVVSRCSDTRFNKVRADIELTRVLLHEMGHVVDFYLAEKKFGLERSRSEGFASFFEQISADKSKIVPAGSVTAEYMEAAKFGISKGFWSEPFGGTFIDYAIHSTFFRAVYAQGALRKIFEIYKVYKSNTLSFKETLLQESYWTKEQLHARARKISAKF